MTSPRLAVNIRGMGRMYPDPPCDPTNWPRNQWKSVDRENIPAGVTMLPSLTNALSVCDRPALKGWAAEHSIRALVNDGYTGSDPDEAVSLYKYAFNKVSKDAADRGTRAHTLAERLARDLPLPASISEEDEAYTDAYMAWWKDHDPKALHVEATVYGDGWAGTGDVVAEVDGVATVVDWKTRAAVDDKKVRKYGLLYETNRMQLAALAHADKVAVPVPALGHRPHDARWRLDDTPFVTQACGVILLPDGTYRCEWLDAGDLVRWYRGFRGALGLWTAIKDYKVRSTA